MPELAKTSELKRIAQVLDVMTRLFEDDAAKAVDKLTVEDACEEVGLAPRTYYNWVHRGDGVIESIRSLIGDQQRRILIRVAAAREMGIVHLVDDATDQDTATKDRVLAMRYLDDIREELERSHHAAPGIEEEAHDFLRKGPKIEKKQSRLASVAVRAGDDPDEVIVDILKDQDVIDITPRVDRGDEQ